MRFRIVKKHNGFFLQTKRLFSWYKVAKHPDGFGLYSKSCNDYPMETLNEAHNRALEYKEWVVLSRAKANVGLEFDL